MTKRALLDLTPTEFENLTFDLMLARGMDNVAWRTPGADGGRDIEGVTFTQDLSGLQTSTRWFVECKRYTGSVDWPTIYGKVAYADALQADILLMCTSSQFTPAAITAVDKWNTSNRALAIRLWPRHQMEHFLQHHPDLLLKYGLSDTPTTPGASIVALALALSKTVGTHYSKIVFSDMQPDPMLEASQALADLLVQRMEDVNREGRLRPVFFVGEKMRSAICEVSNDYFEIDEASLRAFVNYLAALGKAIIKITKISNGVCALASTCNIAELLSGYSSTFSAIALWGDFEYAMEHDSVLIKQRN